MTVIWRCINFFLAERELQLWENCHEGQWETVRLTGISFPDTGLTWDVGDMLLEPYKYALSEAESSYAEHQGGPS